MFSYKSYINTAEGLVLPAEIEERKTAENVTSLFINAKTDSLSIHMEDGVSLELIPKLSVRRYMAVFRSTEFWCQPFFGTDLADIPKETQLLILELENGSFCTLLPLVNDSYKTILEGSKGAVISKSFSWFDGMDSCKGLALVFAVGERPFELIQGCVSSALKLLDNGVKPRTERPYPEVFEYLGWCSWDSMQIRVNEKEIIEKCQEFESKQIPVKWMIIDDMWAEIRDFYGKKYDSFEDMITMMHASRMYHYKADPIRFPKGLTHCIKKVNEYGLSVGMWCPTTGYWKGFDSKGEAFKELNEHLILSNLDALVPSWEYNHAYSYFDTILGFFKESGADFIKIDNQAIFRRHYMGLAPIGKIARQFHNALEDSAKEQFDSKMINCMGMAAENIWSRSASPISRCSNDFLPENKEWFTKHVLQCSYNSLLQGELYWCDWDMWWTDDGQAVKNSLMRAVSGGPIYVSDKLQRSSADILSPLVLSDGKILRCDRPATPTDDCITLDPTESKKALKIQNTAGEYGVMAVLNLDKDAKPVTAEICGEHINGFFAEEYAVYEHFSGECKILKQGESFNVTLENENDYKLYIFAPINNGFAAIGRTDKFISPKTILSVHGNEIELVEDGPYAYVLDGKLHLSEKPVNS